MCSCYSREKNYKGKSTIFSLPTSGKRKEPRSLRQGHFRLPLHPAAHQHFLFWVWVSEITYAGVTFTREASRNKGRVGVQIVKEKGCYWKETGERTGSGRKREDKDKARVFFGSANVLSTNRSRKKQKHRVLGKYWDFEGYCGVSWT